MLARLIAAIVRRPQAFTDGEITCKGDLVGTRVEDFVIPKPDTKQEVRDRPPHQGS